MFGGNKCADFAHGPPPRCFPALFGVPRGYGLIAKTNQRSALESIKTSKNEPKTNPRSERGLCVKPFGISIAFETREYEFIGTVPQPAARPAWRSDS
jgi:hypothetical protein